ncbi:MAG TPA: cysteine dioxygenase family protein [Solirubrobacteraceae bacterium]|nr:cysteine dioxygenase family protein [Solirubrobacteraceae bacterium]
MSLSPEQLERFVGGLVAAPDRWRHLVRHADDVRVYEQIWDHGDVNAWLICWSEDQDTGFHDHDESAAAITVVSGTVREDRLTLGGSPRGRIFGAGETFTVPPVAIHRVLHAGDGPAVTIHAYSPPLRRTGAYRVGVEGALERESQPYEVELRDAPVAA